MSLDSYTNFASVYDTFMDQEPYGLWADRICALLEQYGLRAGSAEEAGIVVDLGCGTGKLTELLAARGYDMIGIDLSGDMLAIAQDRKEASGHDILYSLQDMRDFELYGAAGAMVSAGDSINYLLEEEGLEDMFRCVFRGLLPGGVFVFDFKTIHLYRDLIGDRTIAEDRGTCAFIWDNSYDPGTGINEYALTIFVEAQQDPPEAGHPSPDEIPSSDEHSSSDELSPSEDLPLPDQTDSCEDSSREPVVTIPPAGTLYKRFDELHYQRGYEPDQLQRAARKAGLEWVTMQDVETGLEPGGDTVRILAVVRRPL
ncbi:MAG: class I SAM-dependent methyltransferase [Lachnospiraceae bacterium]|nr:class I SAM-dependent methyltransferase [Lachnospiraceae bacterium]